MNYPEIADVQKADREQICRWYRFLKSPEDKEQTAVMDLICVKFREVGGFTPELSKKIGW